MSTCALRFASRASSIVNDAKAHRDVLTTNSGMVPFLCAHCGEHNDPATSCAVPALGSASVNILQEHLVSTLQIKCEVLTAQLEMARALAEETTHSSRAAVALVPVLLAASARMSSSLRAMLILCLEEGVEVGDTELQSLRDDLKSLRLDLNLPDDTYAPEPTDASAAAGDAQMFADLMSGMPAEWLAEGAGAKGCFECYTPAILLLCDEVARFESDVMARRDQLLRDAAAATTTQYHHHTEDSQRCSMGSALSAASSSGSSMMSTAAAQKDDGAAFANTNNKRGQKRKKDAAGEGVAIVKTKQSRLGGESAPRPGADAVVTNGLSSQLHGPPRLSTSSVSSAGSDDCLSAVSSRGGGAEDAESLDAMLDGISRKELQVVYPVYTI